MHPTTLPLLVLLSACGGNSDDKATDDAKRPSIDISPATLTFEAEADETDTMVKGFTISNFGTAELSFDELTIQSGGSSFTLIDGNSAGKLQPRETRTVHVAFDPTLAEEADGTVIISSNDDKLPTAEVILTGAVDDGDSGEPRPDPKDMKIDVFVLMDTAYDYSCYHPELDNFIRELVDNIYGHFTSVAVGFGLYDDYRVSGWAASGGVPYRMVHQISTDADSVRAAAAGLQMVYGGDSPGSAYEALFQAVWGDGFDQECDGSFDSSTDIRPFMADEDDAFSGAVTGAYDPEVEGSGERPGVGWRDGAAHIVILSSDNVLRDSSMGHSLPEGSCPAAAERTLAVKAFTTTDTRLLSINVYEWQASDDTLQNQLIALAHDTESYLDLDENGTYDDPAVLYGSWDWPDIDDVIAGVEDLAESNND